MHYNSMGAMKSFVEMYLDKKRKLKILEVGSLCLGGTLKRNFSWRRFVNNDNWEYTGLDIEPGSGVDIVSDDPYKYPFKDNSFDVVVTGSTMEHVIDIYKWVKELARITSDLVFIVVPNSGKEHKHPVDCWRVFPDGMRFLLKEVAGLKVIQVLNLNNKDTVGIARKI